ncbi:MAG: hypothetical protein INQ03_03895 [Candidatus Heimdallarchaeota archaeon]|nr:hypothetical protein [Candidatus Heimdallarchaeota archaeon]
MKLKLGILAPIGIQVGILFLYSSIRYQVIDRAIVTVLMLLIFPILIFYVLYPFVITEFGQLKKRIDKRLDKEFNSIFLSDSTSTALERSRTILEEKMVIKENSMVSENIKSKLIPLLTKRALLNYQNEFYSRDNKIKVERSLNYFESLMHFAILNIFFFIFDLILIIIMWFTSVNLYVIVLDEIISKPVFFSMLITSILVLVFSGFLYRYAVDKVEYFLPYVLPILFSEDKEEQYFRQQTIRSLLSYNLDNLLDRREQKIHHKLFSKAQEELVNELISEELVITARKEFAQKIAWREYASIFQNVNIGKDSLLEQLLVGKRIGELKIDEKDLLGLNSDFEYILAHVEQWKKQTTDSRIIAYFRLYRIIEYIIRTVVSVNGYITDEEENNLFNGIKALQKQKLIDDQAVTALHNLRYTRNKLMHEPGIDLKIARKSFTENIEVINNLLEKLSNQD